MYVNQIFANTTFQSMCMRKYPFNTNIAFYTDSRHDSSTNRCVAMYNKGNTQAKSDGSQQINECMKKSNMDLEENEVSDPCNGSVFISPVNIILMSITLNFCRGTV